MSERVIKATERHQAMHKELTSVLKKYADEMSAEEILALTAQLVGQTLALQDQRTMTMERAWDIIGRNIEAGNQHTVEMLLGKPLGSG